MRLRVCFGWGKNWFIYDNGRVSPAYDAIQIRLHFLNGCYAIQIEFFLLKSHTYIIQLLLIHYITLHSIPFHWFVVARHTSNPFFQFCVHCLDFIMMLLSIFVVECSEFFFMLFILMGYRSGGICSHAKCFKRSVYSSPLLSQRPGTRLFWLQNTKQ